jgi:tetratricopeptide (TPR) repeat protein
MKMSGVFVQALLTRNLRAFPVAMVCTSRYTDDGTPVRPVLDENVRSIEVELGTLTRQGVDAMAGFLVGGDVGSEVVSVLMEKTGGNPFFIEQLVIDLSERGFFERDEKGTWRITADLREVPSRINAVLVSRLDRLESSVREVVQTASVCGREFVIDQLTMMLGSELDVILPRIEGAEHKRIWLRSGSAKITFRHVMMRDAAYEMQMRARLKVLHRKAAASLEKIYAGEPGAYYASIMYHYGMAEELERERRYAQLAGQYAADQFANTQAIEYITRALELTQEGEYAERFELLLMREHLFYRVGDVVSERNDIDTLNGLAKRLGEMQVAQAGLKKALFLRMQGDYDATITIARKVVDLARKIRNLPLEVRGRIEWGATLKKQGILNKAYGQIEKALHLARDIPRDGLTQVCLINLGDISRRTCRYEEARNFYQQALTTCREAGDRAMEASSLGSLGSVTDEMGDFEQAMIYHMQSLRLLHELGYRFTEGMELNNLGALHRNLGDPGMAMSCYEKALSIHREVGARRDEAGVLMNLGSLFDGIGQYTMAERCFTQARSIHRDFENMYGESLIDTYLALLSHHRGLNEESLAYCRKAMTVSKQYGDRLNEGWLLTFMGHALEGLGNLADANDAYTRAYELREELNLHSQAVESLSGVARVHLTMGDIGGAMAHIQQVLEFLRTNRTAGGTDEPLRLYLTCYRVLQAVNDPRSATILEKGCSLLQEMASKLPDEGMRRSFLEEVPFHRELLEERGKSFHP